MPYKVIIWAPGLVGGLALVETLRHPDLELVGVFAFSEHKDGVDAASLCDMPDSNIRVTRDKQEILALDADVVIHCASKAFGPETQANNEDDLVRLLESGKNVITTTSYTHLPVYGPELVQRIESACAKGGASFHGTGENPGFMFERFIAALTGICAEVHHIQLDEYADVSISHGEPQMIFDLMSMGKPPEDVTLDRPMVQAIEKMYHQALRGTAEVLGVELERIEPSIETAVLDYDIEIAAGPIRAGGVVGQKLAWTGYYRDKPFLTVRQIWAASRKIPGWGLEELTAWRRNYWQIRLDGFPSARLDMDLWMPETDEPGMKDRSAVHVLVAMTAMRAIPEVCAAQSGVVKAPVFAPFRPRYGA
jgi:hypothetical protein